MSKTTQASSVSAGDRNRYKSYLATGQPPALIEAMNLIAKKRNTTVAALLRAEAKSIAQDAREQLPQKLQRKL